MSRSIMEKSSRTAEFVSGQNNQACDKNGQDAQRQAQGQVQKNGPNREYRIAEFVGADKAAKNQPNKNSARGAQ
ncbi:hypothetical protein KI688_005445 [Linnemannia hyalina]|uniref:Uncharacterized protein n=1 Tax=Linnemannia hyalina TaxID=64524 RepID=A0A9P8BNR7_9FUNG|nr:hypothetical protein KI688_005445 [Linnemannia hyalina]